MQTPLGARVFLLRSWVGVSQREVGRVAGISLGYVAHIESGLVEQIGTKIGRKLAAAFGCSFDYLVFGIGETPTEEQVKAAFAAALEKCPKPANEKAPTKGAA